MTVGNIFITSLVWQICTSGSDQMAIQRYMSTGNLKSAKKSLKISLISSGLVRIVLAILGLAVVAYFMKYPNLMDYGTDIYENADMLFPRFILVGLPVGVSGLVVAGIMAAAMSSLSSGLNSSSTVIVEDIIDRHFPFVLASTDSLIKIKIISAILGVSVAMSSMAVGFIEGNLLDMIFKLVNLFVAPLFVLFFMALFVPKATSKGVFYGGLFALLVAILIAFFNLFNLSVLTIMPISLVVGVIMSWSLSLLDRSCGRNLFDN
jgi:Na+/proline symporter